MKIVLWNGRIPFGEFLSPFAGGHVSLRQPIAVGLLLYFALIIPLLLITKLTLAKVFLYLLYLIPFGIGVWQLWVIRRIPLRIPWHLVGVLQFLIVLSASALLGENPKDSLVYLVSKYYGVILFLLLATYDWKHISAQTMRRAIVISAMLTACYSIYQQWIGMPAFETAWATKMGKVHGIDTFEEESRRSFGFAIYSAGNGIWIGLGLMIAFGEAMKKRTLPSWLGVGVLLLGFVYTLTRGVWLAGIVAIIHLAWVHSRPGLYKLGQIVVLIVLGLVSVIIAAQVSELVATRLESFHGMLTNPDHPFLFRILHWMTSFREKRVTLLGVGPGNAGIMDNMYFNILFSTGIVGLFSFLVMLGGMVSSMNRIIKTESPILPIHSNPRHALSGAIILMMVACLTGDYFESPPANVMFWCLLGLYLNPYVEPIRHAISTDHL